MKPPAQRLQNFPAHFFAGLAQQVSNLKAAGQDVIQLDVGSPDLPPPDQVIAALAQSAARPDRHGYQPHNATPALRRAWADMYRRLHAVELDPDREIIPLIGSKEGIFHFSLAHLDPGDLVLVTDPGYITYSRGALAAGGEPYFLPVSAETGFLPDLSQVPESIARKARLLWLNYPNNPTAATASLEFFASAVEFSRRYDLLVCHDAAYTQITFDGYHAPSLLEVPGSKDVAVEFNTLSKSHNMAGWRVGALVGNPAALKAFYTIKTNADSGHFLPILEAALQALTGDQTWIAVRNQVYQERRDAAIHGLHSLGLKAAVPRASLYVWSPVPQGWTAMQFAQEALTHAGVSLTPGVAFGQNGEGFVRISLTEPVGRIRQAMQRLADWMGP